MVVIVVIFDKSLHPYTSVIYRLFLHSLPYGIYRRGLFNISSLCLCRFCVCVLIYAKVLIIPNVVAPLHGTRGPKLLYYPKGSYYQGLNLEYMTSCHIEVHHLVHIINEQIISFILQTLKCYWAWTQIICWDEKMNMLINFYTSGHQFTKKIITRQSVKIEIKHQV